MLLPQNCSYAVGGITTGLTGSLSPRILSIPQNTASLYFYSDASKSQSGFSISWAAATPINGSACLSSIFSASAVKNCGNDQSGTAGTIQSPNYPSNYNNSLYCNWNIRSPAGTHITLNITDFFTQDGYDQLYVVTSQNCASVINKPLQGLLGQQTITVPQNTASLYFRSDAFFSFIFVLIIL
jgi:hypothetical protein